MLGSVVGSLNRQTKNSVEYKISEIIGYGTPAVTLDRIVLLSLGSRTAGYMYSVVNLCALIIGGRFRKLERSPFFSLWLGSKQEMRTYSFATTTLRVGVLLLTAYTQQRLDAADVVELRVKQPK